jgi:hypothetical protein
MAGDELAKLVPDECKWTSCFDESGVCRETMVLATHLFVPDISFGRLDVLVEGLSYSNEVRTAVGSAVLGRKNSAENWMMPLNSPPVSISREQKTMQWAFMW